MGIAKLFIKSRIGNHTHRKTSKTQKANYLILDDKNQNDNYSGTWYNYCLYTIGTESYTNYSMLISVNSIRGNS